MIKKQHLTLTVSLQKNAVIQFAGNFHSQAQFSFRVSAHESLKNKRKVYIVDPQSVRGRLRE